MISAKYDEKLTRTDEGSAPKIIGCTQGAEARQHVGFQEIIAGNLFKHGGALDAQQWLVNMTDLLKATRIPDENQVEMTKIQLKRYGQDVVVGKSSETGKNPSLGTSSRRISKRRFFSIIAQKEIKE